MIFLAPQYQLSKWPLGLRKYFNSMRPWQRNRIALVLAIILSVVVINLPMLTLNQALSLIALLFVLFAGYVVFWNSYKNK